MRGFRDRSIKSKITAGILLTSTAALSLACLSFMTYDWITIRRAKQQNLAALSRMIAENTDAAISFLDAADAALVLRGLTVDSHIEHAAIFTEDGKLFASYRRHCSIEHPFSTDLDPAAIPEDAVRSYKIAGNHITVWRRIVSKGERLGTVGIRADMGDVHEHMREVGLLTLLFLGCSILVAVAISAAFQHVISGPILHLVGTAQAISKEKDYSVRAQKKNDDELGLLVESFNDMLEKIQQRDEELERHREHLEEKVAARTTEILCVNEELKSSIEKVEEAARTKSEFLANMSHEIRTPLNGILGMTNLALATEMTPEQRDILDLIRESGDTLLRIVNEILDFSKIEAGRLELAPVDFNLRGWFENVLKPLRFRAAEKKLPLIGRVSPRVTEAVVGDPGRLRQVLVNLVGNAIKFTDAGEILVEVDRAEETPARSGMGAVELHFSVKDSGIGIPEHKQQDIFDTFSQADGSTTRRFGGTGLGLAISRKLVSLMGGQIWVESHVHSGSTFHFTALVGIGSSTGHGVVERGVTAFAGQRILIAEANASQRKVFEEICGAWSMDVHSACDPEETVARLQEARVEAAPFSFVLLDDALAVEDFEAFARRISDVVEGTNARIGVFLSASGIDTTKRARPGAWYVPFLKPIGQIDLLICLESLRTDRASPSDRYDTIVPPPETRSTEEETDATDTPRVRVLLAEDNRVNQRVAAAVLTKNGYDVTIAENGRKAIEMLQRSPFDVVLMDVSMPEMDGFETTTEIRKRDLASGQHTPIIAMTAHAMAGDRQRCLEVGMDDYISKPIDAGLLVKAIEKALAPSA